MPASRCRTAWSWAQCTRVFDVAEFLLGSASESLDPAESLGRRLGESTGWILKAKLREARVGMTAGATYDAIDDQGLHYTVNGDKHVLEADTIVICAGQFSNREFEGQLLDAPRAIDQATGLAVSFERFGASGVAVDASRRS